MAPLPGRGARGVEVRLMVEIVRVVAFLDGDDDDHDYDKESIISTNTDIFETPSSFVITTSPHVLLIEDPKVSLIIGNEELNTISEKESDEFIKSSVEDLIPIPSESEDTSRSDSECILPSCDYFSTIDVPKEESVAFSNPLLNSNDDFTYSDDESLSKEDVLEDNLKIYLNPLFEFDDEYIFSDVNPLFDEVLENIKSRDSYDSNLDELSLPVTPLSDANEDKCFDLGGDVDEINDFEDGYYDSEGDILYLESLLSDDTTINLPPETAEEKKNRKIDRLAITLLIQGLPNNIYFLIDSNETAKDLWDALERQMRGSEYGEQDRKAAILYEY
nr:hypothetical protein [Tanacetum cinerariifolium]